MSGDSTPDGIGRRVPRDTHGTGVTIEDVAIHGTAVGVEPRDLDVTVPRDPPVHVLAALRRDTPKPLRGPWFRKRVA